MTKLYVNSHKVRVIQSPVSQYRVDRTVLLHLCVTSGSVDLGIQELLSDTCFD